MAFPSPAVTTGQLATASDHNTYVKDPINALYAGALAISSQAALDFLYASTTTQMARLAAAAYSYPRLNAAGSAWEMAKVPMERLTASADSGTTTNAGAENVATVSISGLTAKDTLLVVGTIRAITQNVSTIRLWNNTDSVEITPINDQGGAGNYEPALGGSIFQCNIRQFQHAATAVMGMTDLQNGANTRSSLGTASTYATNWTGSWTLALRHSGVTAGGTLQWSWSVFVVRGQ